VRKAYLEIRVQDLPEVEVQPEFSSIKAGGWSWGIDEPAPTREDLLAVAAAVRWFEQHPEVVPDVRD
jgi:hypothetical protein